MYFEIQSTNQMLMLTLKNVSELNKLLLPGMDDWQIFQGVSY